MLTKIADYFLKDCVTISYHHCQSMSVIHVATFEYDHCILYMVGGVLLSQGDTARSNFETVFGYF